MDRYLFDQINGLAGKFSWLDALAVFFAEDLAFLLVLLVLVIFFRKKIVILLSFSAAFLAGFGIAELINLLWQRPRPFIENNTTLLIDKVNQPAFPSIHTIFFFALSTVIYSYNKKAGILFFIASCLMGISRVFCGVHWVSDILAGAILGIFCGWLTLFLFSSLKKRLTFEGIKV